MIPTICIGGFDDQKLVAVKNAGFKYVELSFGEVAIKKDDELKEYLSRLDALGFIPVAGNGFFPWNFTPEYGFFRENYDEGMIREYVDMAFEKTAAIKWNSISFGNGRFRETPDGYDHDKAIDKICGIISDIIVPKLEKYDAILSLEELRKEETNFITSCMEALTIVEKINHPRFGILCDYYHMINAGETAEDLPKFVNRITHLHIASPSNNRAIPVKGDSDNDKYLEFFAALKDCGYAKKYLSVEGGIPEEADVQNTLSNCYSYLSSLTHTF